MAITYLHICTQCDLSYSDQINTPKNEAVCPACTMQPDFDIKNEFTNDDNLSTHDGEHNTLYVDGKKEVLPRACGSTKSMSKHHIPHNAQTTKNRPEKNCEACGKPYQPRGNRQKWCNLCQDTCRAKKAKVKNDARPKNDFIMKKSEKEAIADDLLKASIKKVPEKIVSNTLVFDTAGTSINPGFTRVKRQPAGTVYEGFWTLEKTGTTFDHRQYDVRRNPISGQVAVCLCNPTEVYLSDATNAQASL